MCLCQIYRHWRSMWGRSKLPLALEKV
jgi:hypothetical protein